MARTLGIVASAVVVGWMGAASAEAQPPTRPSPDPAIQVAAAVRGAVQGLVVDERGAPLPGAVISALGSTTAFAVSDRTGRFTLQSLPPGAYVLRAHLQGFVPARARMVEVRSASKDSMTIELRHAGATTDPGHAPILQAGVGGRAVASTPESPGGDDLADPDHDHGEIAWRLRHLKRSVLKDATTAAIVEAEEDSSIAASLAAFGRAIGSPIRLAGSLFEAYPLSGQVNLLTTTSFDQSQDLLSGSAPRGIAYVSLGAATGDYGDWSMRAAFTQGDLSSWVVAGGYVTRIPGAHRLSVGMSHGLQRYQGGNAAALLATPDGARTVGSLSVGDRWTIRRGIAVGYGAAYSRYDYLATDGLFSPRADVTLTPVEGLRFRVAASRPMVAPGADEFLPPPQANLWLPPQRTFAPLSHRGFQPERTTHYEVGVEQDLAGQTVLGLRAFRQQVAGQIVTIFGTDVPGMPPTGPGHYWVASGGDVMARGWSVSLSRTVSDHLRGSVDYTFAQADWLRSGDALLAVVAPSALRANAERLQDLTATVEATAPYTATRVYLLYRMNNAFATEIPDSSRARTDRRFELRVSQALPFLDFTSAQWEMLMAIGNTFHEEQTDSSIYDELLVIRPPKRVVGGLTVRF